MRRLGPAVAALCLVQFVDVLGVTSVVVTHEMDSAFRIADRMVLLSGGRVAAAGTPREVLTAELLAAHYRVRVRIIEGDQGPLVVPVRTENVPP